MLVLPSWYPTRRYPMGGIFCQEQARATEREGTCRALVLFVDRVPVREWFRERSRPGLRAEEGLKVYRTQMPRLPGIWPLLYVPWAVLSALRVRRLGYRFDLVHAHVALPAGLAGAFMKRLFRVPLVLTEHTGPFSMLMRDPAARVASRVAFRAANRVIAVSNALRAQILAYPQLRRRIDVLPNLVNVEDFAVAPQPRSEDAPFRLLFVGEMETSIKGVDYLLGAVSLLRKKGAALRVDLVGQGRNRRDYEALARRLEVVDICQFHDVKPHAEIARLMAQADLFVLPSLAETFGVVLVEALAAGTPVMSTRCGGPEEIVTPDVGLLVEPANSTALAEGIEDMLSRLAGFPPEHLRAVAAERFGQESVARRLCALYSEVVRR